MKDQCKLRVTNYCNHSGRHYHATTTINRLLSYYSPPLKPSPSPYLPYPVSPLFLLSHLSPPTHHHSVWLMCPRPTHTLPTSPHLTYPLTSPHPPPSSSSLSVAHVPRTTAMMALCTHATVYIFLVLFCSVRLHSDWRLTKQQRSGHLTHTFPNPVHPIPYHTIPPIPPYHPYHSLVLSPVSPLSKLTLHPDPTQPNPISTLTCLNFTLYPNTPHQRRKKKEQEEAEEMRLLQRGYISGERLGESSSSTNSTSTHQLQHIRSNADIYAYM